MSTKQEPADQEPDVDGAIGADVDGARDAPTAPTPVAHLGPVPAGLALLPGLATAAGVAVVATILGGLVPVVGPPVFAIVGGAVLATRRLPSERLRPGLTFAGKQVLQGSIMVLGLGLSLGQVLSVGATSLPVLVGTLVIALAMAWLAGRILHVRRDLNVLIGVGTAICGASAIAATDAVIDADEADVSYAIATIFTCNVAAVLAFPVLGHILGLSQHAFGLWAGTAINDTSSVVAASTVFGHAATSTSVVVKLTRTLAIIPICLGLAAWRAHRSRTPSPPTGTGGAGQTPGPSMARSTARTGFQIRRVVPVFVLGFVAAVTANTIGLVPACWHRGLADLATWMITVALAAIGLSTKLGHIRRAGPRPVVLGAVLWVTVGAASLALQAATGTI